MVIDKNTQLCISISSNPGTTGSTIHNHLYKKHKLNYIYKPFVGDNIREVMLAVRTLGIRGCGVSMPFKTGVGLYIDDIEPQARLASSINTVVNTGGFLVGHNTDIDGARLALVNLCTDKIRSATVYGAGATAHSVCVALAQLDVEEVKIWNRTVNRAWSLKRFVDDELSMDASVVYGREKTTADLLINCSALGMDKDDVFPMESKMFHGYRFVLDVVNRDTDLVRRAEPEMGSTNVQNGRTLAIYQSLIQFQLYTGVEIDVEEERREIEELLG
jgi:shikimate dehydrogenase